MEFEILVARFRKLHAVIFGLTESGKTKEELKEEFLVLEKKIKDEARRDGALPNQLIQKILTFMFLTMEQQPMTAISQEKTQMKNFIFL